MVLQSKETKTYTTASGINARRARGQQELTQNDWQML